MKNKRQDRILALISEKDIETQEELSTILRGEGFNVTQATVSRDIRELKLVKTVSPDGGFKYIRGKESGQSGTSKQVHILTAAFSDVDYAGNIAVVRTVEGMAQGAAAAIETMRFDGIVGSVAGDDTIIFVMRSEAAAAKFAGSIADIVKDAVHTKGKNQ